MAKGTSADENRAIVLTWRGLVGDTHRKLPIYICRKAFTRNADGKADEPVDGEWGP